MTRSNSKNKPRTRQQNTKQTNITDSDGWTHVVRGPTAVRLHASSPKVPSSAPSSSLDKPNAPSNVLPGYILTPPPLASLAELKAEHAKQRHLLTDTDIMRGLRNALEVGLDAHPQVYGISNAVCVGLGSLSTFRRTTSMRQLIAFEMAIEVLREKKRIATTASASSRTETPATVVASVVQKGISDEETQGDSVATSDSTDPSSQSLDVFFQELAFTPLDVSFLSSRGYRVIEIDTTANEGPADTAASSSSTYLGPIGVHLSESTFFFAPHLETDVIRLATDIAVPRLYLGTNIRELDARWPLLEIERKHTPQISEPPRSPRNSKSKEMPTEGMQPMERSRLQQQRLSERWLLSTDWVAPKEVKRVGHDDGNWASDFAFAFKKTSDKR